jgi:uncharacterized protein
MYWMDLSGGDPDFYLGLFGWEPTDDGVFTVDGQAVAGHGAPGRPGWNPHALVEDVTEACRRAEELGGRVLSAPEPSATGTVATLADPTGAAFAVREPGRRTELSHKPMTFTWAELCTTEPDAARSFYPALLGWHPVEVSIAMPSGPVGYTVFMASTAEAGGLLPAEGGFGPAKPPYWLAYIEVENTDKVAAHAEELGGAVLVEPFDVPRIGRIALLAGRAGEHVALMQMPAAGQ